MLKHKTSEKWPCQIKTVKELLVKEFYAISEVVDTQCYLELHAIFHFSTKFECFILMQHCIKIILPWTPSNTVKYHYTWNSVTSSKCVENDFQPLPTIWRKVFDKVRKLIVNGIQFLLNPNAPWYTSIIYMTIRVYIHQLEYGHRDR